MDELWNFAKQIAQSDGRKNDWVYIIDVYKSIGGKEMAMEIFNETGRYEVLGEAPNNLVLINDKNKEISAITKSDFKRFRKKFHKRNLENTKTILKSIIVEGKQHSITLYVNDNI